MISRWYNDRKMFFFFHLSINSFNSNESLIILERTVTKNKRSYTTSRFQECFFFQFFKYKT